MAPLDRNKRINLQATEDEQEKLRDLADREGVSMSDYVRQLIRRQHAAVFGEQSQKPSKPKGRKRR